MADGRAVLRSSIREFLCSEAMHHLRVPTTRALSLVVTGEQVVRDMFYDGHPRPEPGAVVCRVAPSFVRFGNFELPAARGDLPLLKRLIDFTIQHDYPQLLSTGADVHSLEVRAEWFAQVCERTARLVAEWLRVGFVHGVMNTDNMSILGLTIDYGPYGWIDNFDFDWTPNTTDASGRRYRFGQQPNIALWNLSGLAGALLRDFGAEAALQAGLDRYVAAFTQAEQDTTVGKLGLRNFIAGDLELLQELQTLLYSAEVDMTLFFRELANIEPAAPSLQRFSGAFYDENKRRAAEPALTEWLQRYVSRLNQDQWSVQERQAQMNAANPRYVLRNYLAQQAIDRAEQGDCDGIHELLEVLRRPYQDQPGCEQFAQRRPEWARHRAGCSMLSCSS
jgi:uncharacterized protein YdiU (UPF0061 family)